MRSRSLYAGTFVLLLANVCLACLWDFDTLAAEARGRPGVAEVLVGWFDRWPDAVYEERLARRAALYESDPSDLALYDDAGVACDRLGRYDEAIAWMERKRTALDALDTPDAEHEYRYHANLGTFYAHRWFAGGADHADPVDLMKARYQIASAILINPDAHFGREVVQLRFIDMLLGGHSGRVTFLGDDGVYPAEPIDQRRRKVFEGLIGLVEMGNAWGSVHVFRAIAEHAQWTDGTLAYLAWLRIEELSANGNVAAPLWESDSEQIESIRTGDHLLREEMASDVEAWWREARAAADARNAAREAFILEKLEGGTHPDDVGWDVFFAGWTEPELPTMPDTRHNMSPEETIKLAIAIAIGSGVVLILLTVLSVRWWARRRSRTRAVATA